MMEKIEELLIKFCPAFVLACWCSIRVLVGMMFLLLLIDNITAIYEAWKFRKKGEKWFHHSKMYRTIEKFIAYGVAMIVGWTITQIIGIDFGLDTFISGYIAVYEGISIFGHLSRITGLTLFIDIIDWLKNRIDFKKYMKKGKNNDTNNNGKELYNG